jgi:glycogen operon protein
VEWFVPGGEPMTGPDWEAGSAKSFAVFLNGLAIAEPDDRGEQVLDDSFLLLFNAHHEPQPFTLPPGRFGEVWESVLDTAVPVPTGEHVWLKAQTEVVLEGRALAVLQRVS